GVIISAKGYIVTNYHVIADAVALDVYLSDGRKASGQLIGSDSSVDLALLKIDLPDLAVAKLGNSDNLAVGQLAFAIGNPGGAQFTRSMTMGLISGLNRELELPDGNIYNLIQTDAAINPGNSGGPLVDIYGEVIGITSIKIVDTYFEGMGFAIPIATVVRVIDELAIPISTSIW
ncbi:MAG: trypsin-like peptidase domain-containing protein, partial [Clostridiales bacterium]